MNNFYTATVYEKGAKVVHMLRTILGEKKFQGGMKLYFQLMTAKLRAAKISSKPCKMPIRSICKVFCLGIVLQAGTPVVEASRQFNTENKRVILHLT